MAQLNFATMVEVLDWDLDPAFVQEYGDLVGELVTRRFEAFEEEHGEDVIQYCSRAHDCPSLSWPKDFPLGSAVLHGVPLTLDAVRDVKRLWRSILGESVQEARLLLGHSDADAQAAHERILFDRVVMAFGRTHRIQRHGKPAWLAPQHLDIWFPDNNLAIEFQGLQHFIPVDYFGGESRFRDQSERDLRKRRLCESNGCHLVIVDQDYEQEALLKVVGASLSHWNETGAVPATYALGQQSRSILAAREALENGSSLEFDYLSRDGSLSHRIAVPICFERARRPCLRAYCTLRNSERLFAFEAMSNVKLV